MGLVKLGFHFGGVPLRLVEVEGVSTGRKPLFRACASLSRMPFRRSCFFGVARLFPSSHGTPMGLVKLGVHFGGVPFAFGGSGRREYKPQALVSRMCLNLTHAIPALLIFRSCASIRELTWDSQGSSEAGIPFSRRSAALGGSGRREYKLQSLFVTGAS